MKHGPRSPKRTILLAIPIILALGLCVPLVFRHAAPPAHGASTLPAADANPRASLDAARDTASDAQTVDSAKKAAPEVPVAGITVSDAKGSATAYLVPGETARLRVIITPSNATRKETLWTSSNRSVATVSATGVLTAVGYGTTRITVSDAAKAHSASMNVNVIERVQGTGLEIEAESREVAKGGTTTLSAAFSPPDTTNKSVTWTSSDPAVATVSSAGKVAGMELGEAMIYASNWNRALVAAIPISVRDGTVLGVALTPPSVKIARGEKRRLRVTMTPAYALNRNCSWTTSDASIAEVDDSGTVTGLREGTATVTATTEEGGYRASCSVTVDTFPFTLNAAAGRRNWVGVALSGDGSLLLATTQDRLYASNDRGKTWRQQPQSRGLGLRELTISSDGALIAALSEASSGGGEEHSRYIYLSRDRGASWKRCAEPGKKAWSSIAVSSDGSTIAASVDGGFLYYSGDAGATWKALESSGESRWTSVALSAHGSIVMAAVSGSTDVYRSTNRGVSWKVITAGLNGCNILAMSDNGSTIFAGGFGLYRSMDGGATWSTAVDSVTVRSLSASADGREVLFCYDYTAYRLAASSDSGATWKKMGRDYNYISDAAISDDGTLAAFVDYGNALFFREKSSGE